MSEDAVYRCVNCGCENEPKDIRHGHCKECEESYENKREIRLRSLVSGKDY